MVGDDASPNPGQDEIIRGTDYQEVQSDFPLSSQILTGLFLNVTLAGPGYSQQTYQHTIFDGIGIAARASGAPVTVSTDPGQSPPLTELDTTTLNVLAADYDPAALTQEQNELPALQEELGTLIDESSTSQPSASQDLLLQQEIDVLQLYAIMTGRIIATNYDIGSDILTSAIAREGLVSAYFDAPRITIVDTKLQTTQGSTNQAPEPGLQVTMDLLKDTIRTVVAPGQAANVSFGFNVARGMNDSVLESQSLPPSMSQTPELLIGSPVSAVGVFNAAQTAGIPVTTLMPTDMAAVDGLDIPANAQTLIEQALAQGEIVAVPAQSVTINGQSAVAWFEIDPTTGYTVGVLGDGTHGLDEYTSVLAQRLKQLRDSDDPYLFIAGFLSTAGFGAVAAVFDVLVQQTRFGILAKQIGRQEFKSLLIASLDEIEEIIEGLHFDPAFAAGADAARNSTGFRYSRNRRPVRCSSTFPPQQGPILLTLSLARRHRLLRQP